MTEKIPFGQETLSFAFPEEWERRTLLPNPSTSLEDPDRAIVDALKNPIHSPPLSERVRPGQRITIVISDITRLWVRTDFFLPHLLRILNERGIRDEAIRLLVATGSHRDNSPREIKTITGGAAFPRVKALNHHAKEMGELIHLGRTPLGTEVWVNRAAVESDLLIVTGGITFHSLSGFSGGRKGILPGISGYDTIQQNHRLALREGGGVLETVRKGQLEGNPVSDDMLSAARMVPNLFLFNVVANEEGRMVQVLCGDLQQAHRIGCETVKNISSVSLKEKVDLVLAGPGGYPWDISLYQSIKGLENASFAAREGGTIILVAECRDGLGPPDWVHWFELGGEKEIEDQLRKGFTIPGFIALKTVSLLRRFRVLLVSRLKENWVKKIGMTPAPSVSEAIRIAREEKKTGANAIFMPHGAFVLPVH
jgi:nickel-dependent lactate racemase